MECVMWLVHSYLNWRTHRRAEKNSNKNSHHYYWKTFEDRNLRKVAVVDVLRRHQSVCTTLLKFREQNRDMVNIAAVKCCKQHFQECFIVSSTYWPKCKSSFFTVISETIYFYCHLSLLIRTWLYRTNGKSWSDRRKWSWITSHWTSLWG